MGRVMLQAMRQAASSASPSNSPSFSGLLAALTAPASAAVDRALTWNDDDLADDVTTLSYESWLQAHARYRPVDPVSADPADRPLTYADDLGPSHFDDPIAARAIPTTTTPAPQVAPSSHSYREAETAHGPSTQAGRKPKCANITLRVSQDEHAQLRERATEAGLSVSAYLRSCTFEAESLRAQVKEALAQLRSDAPDKGQTPSAPARSSSVELWSRFLAHWPQWARRPNPMRTASTPLPAPGTSDIRFPASSTPPGGQEQPRGARAAARAGKHRPRPKPRRPRGLPSSSAGSRSM